MMLTDLHSHAHHHHHHQAASGFAAAAAAAAQNGSTTHLPEKTVSQNKLIIFQKSYLFEKNIGPFKIEKIYKNRIFSKQNTTWEFLSKP